MKKLLMGLGVLILLLAACRENVDVLEVDLELPEAKELGDFQLLGSIKDASEEGLLSAKVELLQDGAMLESTTTDRDGKYAMKASIKLDQAVYVRAAKEGFVTAMESVEVMESTASLNTVLMPSEMLGRGQSSTSETEFVSLFGTLIDQAGTVQPRKYIILEDETGRINYATTNREGRFRIAAPLETALELVVVNAVCGEEEYRADIGLFAANQDLGNITIAASPNESISISGQLLDCDGMPISNGIVLATSGNERLQVRSDASGNFSLEITTCSGNRGVNLFGYDASFQNVSEAVNVADLSGAATLDPITVCTLGAFNIEVIVNGVDYKSEAAHTFLLNNRGGAGGLNYIYPRNRRTGLTIYFPGTSTGTFDANTFLYIDENIAVSGGSRARNGSAISVTVTTYETDLMEGTFTGQALNEETQVLEEVSGSFSIRI
ncbi:MAG: hypothetical protein AAGI49_16215 [Bacteroidota bacterium]